MWYRLPLPLPISGYASLSWLNSMDAHQVQSTNQTTAHLWVCFAELAKQHGNGIVVLQRFYGGLIQRPSARPPSLHRAARQLGRQLGAPVPAQRIPGTLQRDLDWAVTQDQL